MQKMSSTTPETSQEVAVEEKFVAPYGELRQAGGAPPAQSRGMALIFSSFKHRNYQLWFGGQLISVIGTWMQIIAQGWLVYEISHSELALGIVSFASAIPVLFVSPWGGVITDLMPKRTLIVLTQSTAMLLALVLAALTFTGRVQVWHIYILAALLGVVNAFDAPARQAFIVEMVGREDLPNAIALNSMMFNGARVIGPAIGGVLLAWLGSAWCFLLNGVSYIAVIISLLMMVVAHRSIPRRVEKPLRQFMEGVRYARSDRGILGLLLLSAVFSLFGMAYSALLPAFVDQVLHQGATGYGVVNTAIGIGAVLGALFVARFSAEGSRGKTLSIANLIYPVLLGAFGLNVLFPTALALAFSIGLIFMLQGNNINSLLQLSVEDSMRGRIMSLYTLTFFGLSPFGSLAAGAMAEVLPMSVTIGITAIGMLFFSLIIQWRMPEIRRLR